MTKKELTAIAIHHFKKMRTTGTFLRIVDIIPEDNTYLFHALFRGKKKVFPKSIRLDQNGKVSKL
jgi:hypothetical protein